jgi:hypothetical protein
MNTEVVDSYKSETLVISAGDVSISGGISNFWHLPLVDRGNAASFFAGYKGYADCELHFYRKGAYSKDGWGFSLPGYVEAATSDPKNTEVRFKADEEGRIQIELPFEDRGREVLDKNGEVIFSSKRTTFPTLWGKRYYVVEYEITENPDTEEALEVTVDELFLSLDSMDVHLIFRAPTEYQAGLYQSLTSYLKQFYIVGKQ